MADDFSRIYRLAASLRADAQQVKAGARTVVRVSGARVEATSKARCPVDTGNLRNSISTTPLKAGLGVEVGPTANYAEFVEFGTSRMAPQPYMGPALDAVEPQFVQAMGQLAGRLSR